jgi:predicted nucleic acid-binding protein
MTAFFDTNVLIYAQAEGRKGELAQELIAQGGVISVQNLNEFVNVMRRKTDTSWDAIDEAINDILATCGVPRPLTVATHLLAKQLARDHRFHICDATILAAAMEAGCDMLYSEDLHAGWRGGGLRVVNPFR